MTSPYPTTRIEHDFNAGWMHDNPKLAVQSIVDSVLASQKKGLTVFTVDKAYMPGMAVTLSAEAPRPDAPKRTPIGRANAPANISAGQDVTVYYDEQWIN